MSTDRSRPFWWVDCIVFDRPTPLRAVGARSFDNVLVPVKGGGYALRWTFDSDDDGDFQLLAHLTKREARRVLSKKTPGMLESVRRDLDDRTAVISAPGRRFSVFEIAAAGSEDEFIDTLFAAVERMEPQPFAEVEEARIVEHFAERFAAFDRCLPSFA